MEALSWSITKEQERSLLKRVFKLSLPFIVGIVFFLIFDSWKEDQKLSTNIVGISVVLVIVLLFFILKIFFLMEKREYSLSLDGIQIQKKEKKIKSYQWNQFEYFFERTPVGNIDNLEKQQVKKAELYYAAKGIYQVSRYLDRVFLLRKKSGFLKTFVMIHALPENAATVEVFLKQYLPQRPASHWIGFAILEQ